MYEYDVNLTNGMELYMKLKTDGQGEFVGDDMQAYGLTCWGCKDLGSFSAPQL